MVDPHAQYYDLLRTCLQETPPRELLKALAEQAVDPPLNSNYDGLKEGWRQLADFFARQPFTQAVESVGSQYDFLLGNPLRPKLEPYASHYLNGSRQGEALAQFRGFMRKWRLVPEPGKFKDYEDHAVFVLDTVVQLINLTQSEGDKWEEVLEECLLMHVIPWFPAFLQDMEKEDLEHGNGGFYAGLALIGRAILASEAQVLQ